MNIVLSFSRRRLALALAGALVSLAGSARASAPAPAHDQQDLFTAQTQGYAHFRIPGIVATPGGTCLVYCEARRSTSGDWGATDILMRRSTDGGQTWGPVFQPVAAPGDVRKNPIALARNLGKEGEVLMNNPLSIVDAQAGLIHLLYCVEYERCFISTSHDDGRTFEAPREITATFEAYRPAYDWKVLATGPGHGIQLRSGRLVVPVWLSTGTGGHAHRPSVVSVIVSDDHGATWQAGPIVVAHPQLTNPSETTAVELDDGRVLLNIRHESEPRFRAVSTSPNGRNDWTPARLDDALPEPVCFASLVRLPGATAGEPSQLLFVNPAPPGGGRERKNLTVRLSPDVGQTWPVARVLEPGVAGYADLAVTPDRQILCFYECGTISGAGTNPSGLRLARFNEAWLRAGPSASAPAESRSTPPSH